MNFDSDAERFLSDVNAQLRTCSGAYVSGVFIN
jgi:hypothetical protein